jgi:hypothetical protein
LVKLGGRLTGKRCARRATASLEKLPLVDLPGRRSQARIACSGLPSGGFEDKHESVETAFVNADQSGPEGDVKNTSSSGAVYKVGYGHAPKQTRFPPGRSGNLRGRPKGRSQKTLAMTLQRTLALNIGELRNGLGPQTPILDALLRKLACSGLAGQHEATRLLLQTLQSISKPGDPD